MSRNVIEQQLHVGVSKGHSDSSFLVRFSPHPRLPKSRSFCLLAVTTLLIFLLTTMGCSKKELDDLVSKAKDDLDKVKKTVEEEIPKAIGAASEELGMSGKASIRLDTKTFPTNACYVSLIEQSPDRPNVLKIQSYASPDSESFPSLFIQAQVGDSTLEELVGTEIMAQVFVQTNQGGEVWYTEPTDSLRVKISALEENMLTAELAGGKLHSTVSGNSVDAVGSMEAVVQ